MKAFALVARCKVCGWLSQPYTTDSDLREYDNHALRIVSSNLVVDRNAHLVHHIVDGSRVAGENFESIIYQRVEQKPKEQVFKDWANELMAAGWYGEVGDAFVDRFAGAHSLNTSLDILEHSRWKEPGGDRMGIQDAINQKRGR